MEYMCQLLRQIEAVEKFSDDLDNESLVNRAIDVRSASMLYLAAHVRHDKNRLGEIGASPIAFTPADISESFECSVVRSLKSLNCLGHGFRLNRNDRSRFLRLLF